MQSAKLDPETKEIWVTMHKDRIYGLVWDYMRCAKLDPETKEIWVAMHKERST